MSLPGAIDDDIVLIIIMGAESFENTFINKEIKSKRNKVEKSERMK
jgi:hypothetical protein